jgi:hypothetical protein
MVDDSDRIVTYPGQYKYFDMMPWETGPELLARWGREDRAMIVAGEYLAAKDRSGWLDTASGA